MPVELLKGEAVVEHFRDQVRIAMGNQRVLVDELTEWYIVNLLASLGSRGGFDRVGMGTKDWTVTQKLIDALNLIGGSRKAQALREIGDQCLIIPGLWPEKLKRKLVDVDFYIHFGRYAFKVLGDKKGAELAKQFKEISSKFSELIEVLAEVAEASKIISIDNRDLLQLYERYLATRNPRLGNILKEKGFSLPPPITRNKKSH